VSLNEEASKKLLNFIRDYTKATDVLVVSTCNRTEIYYVAEQDYSSAILKGHFADQKIFQGDIEHHLHAW
jgi:glutamyl-tRNA reductase